MNGEVPRKMSLKLLRAKFKRPFTRYLSLPFSPIRHFSLHTRDLHSIESIIFSYSTFIMQYKALATVLFAAAAVAAPAEDFDFDNLSDFQDIASAVQTVVPTAWAQSLYSDPGFAKSVLSDLDAGTYPPWYSSLPAEIRSDAPAPSEVAQGYSKYIDQLGSLGVLSTLTAAGSGSASGTRSAATATQTASSTVTSAASTATVTTSTGSKSTSDSTSSGSASGSASGSGSGSGSASGSAGATGTSTGGAPAATGHVAMGLAGAAGVLGLALAL